MTKHQDEAIQALLAARTTARSIVLNGLDLREVPLAGLRADAVNFDEADLRNVKAKEVRWTDCSLRDARLEDADFSGSVLRMCDLGQARVERALFVGARIENSTAVGARFDGADLTDAVLTDTDFSRAALRKANLSGVSATGADFRGADLREALLIDADLTDCDLRGADLSGASLKGATLHGADLRGAAGIEEAVPDAEAAWADLPDEFRDLAEMMAPIVAEVLRASGNTGLSDPETAERLAAEASRYAGQRGNAPSPDTMEAVSKVIAQMKEDTIPTLLASLRLADDADPPQEVKDLILRLRTELDLDDSAGAEDILNRMTRESGPTSR